MSVVPCIRGCDDASGMSQTAGFPFPFSARTNANALFANVDWVTVGVNALCLLVIGAVLLTRFPDLASRVTSLRVAVVLALYAAFNFLFGWIVFFPLLIPAIGLNAIVEIDLPRYMDIASRLLLVGIVAAAARATPRWTNVREARAP
ncbi:MAG: hypothetical protein MUD17_14165 [Gemmatimonadaceae bacterium]|nr:hypothetical protein [Gemmatimonadaceae bacterium]